MKPYRPSNGSEGLVFQHRYCNRCIHDKAVREEPPRWESGCQVWASALMFKTDEPEYPPELVYANEEDVFSGRCTKFEQDPAEPVYGPDTPRTFPLPSEVVGAYLGGAS
jgi:hypothetical protein